MTPERYAEITRSYRDYMAGFIGAQVEAHKAMIALQAKQNREHINRSLWQHGRYLFVISGGKKP